MTINISPGGLPAADTPDVTTPGETQEAPVKKGNESWKESQLLDVDNKSPDFRYRWCWVDDMNVEKKLREGWVFVNKETGIPGEHKHPNRADDGKPLDSAKRYRDTVLMALPEERGKARDRHFQEKTDQQTLDAKKFLEQKKQRAGNPAPTYQPTVIR